MAIHVRGGEHLPSPPPRPRSIASLPHVLKATSLLRMQVDDDVPQRSGHRQIMRRRRNIILYRGAQMVLRASDDPSTTAMSIQIYPSSGSLVDLAVVADITPDHDGAAEAFGSMT